MAPKRRANHSWLEIPTGKSTLVSGSEKPLQSSKGFLSLPDELYLEIASHIPSMPLPTEYPLEGDPELQDYQARHMNFAALSQTCRSMRPAFMKSLWQRIEVIDGMQTPIGRLPSAAARKKLKESSKGKNKRARRFTQELLRQLEIVTIREPSLAKHVREINVVFLPKQEDDSVLERLARYATSFPNLHTVQLVFNDRVSSIHSRKLLAQYNYPQVTTLAISHPLHNIFQYRGVEKLCLLVKSCPGLRRLAPCMNDFCVNAVFDSPNLEVFGPVFFGSSHARKILELPRLRDITIHSDNFFDEYWKIEYLEPLQELKNLHTIRIDIREDITRNLEDYTERLQSWVNYCRGLLSSGNRDRDNIDVPVKKQVMVMHYSVTGRRRVESYGV